MAAPATTTTQPPAGAAPPPVTRAEFDDLLRQVKAANVGRSHVADLVEKTIGAQFDQLEEKLAKRHEASQSQAPAQFIAGVAQSSGERAGVDATWLQVVAATAVSEASTRRNNDIVSPITAADFAEQAWGEGSSAHTFLAARGSAATQTGDDGAALIVPGSVHQRLVEKLEPEVAVLGLQPNTIPMPSGSMRQVRQTTSPTAAYTDEDDIHTSQGVQFRDIQYTGRKCTGTHPVSNDLLRAAAKSPGALAPDVMAFIERGLVRSMGRSQDLAFIRGAGVDNVPKGLRWQIAAAHVVAATGPADFKTVLGDLGRLLDRMEEANLTMSRPGWLFRSGIKNFLQFRTIEPGSGTPFFFKQMSTGELLGYPFRVSNQMPGTINGNETELMIVDMDYVNYAIETATTVEASLTGSYLGADGKEKSAWRHDETVIRAISKHDIQMEHPEAGAVLTGVTWATAA